VKNLPPTAEITNYLFTNSDPAVAWEKAVAVIKRTSPAYDLSFARTIFDDVIDLFRGKHQGYCAIKTPYHDMPHTLDVFLCAVRLMHGVHLSGTPISDSEITHVIIATLMHDVGYAQRQGEESGTGAQHTREHIARGLAFMRQYVWARGFSADFADSLMPIMRCSDPLLPLSQIKFPNERIRLLGQIVGTADLVGQMADRAYLEKLPALYQEFQEAKIGNYQSMYDMLRQTNKFYAIIQKKLDGDFGGLYTKLSFHFRDTLGVDNNYYMESIAKNMTYLSEVTALDESEYSAMVKRGGIMRRIQH
jgi:hypothetical protein